jgi:hypothetical protein
MRISAAQRHGRTAWIRNCVIAALLGLALGSAPSPARADIAPPDYPPGANLVPGSETTQVRMVAETVTLAVQLQSASDAPGQVITTCDFQMRNLGTETERMQVRFPLTFLYGGSNGWGEFPEIRDLRVRVNGGTVATRRVTSAAPGDAYSNSDAVPWAAFDVAFPPNEDVQIQVIYTGDGIGEYPYLGFRYILETGAGWKDTIGSADLIVHYPFEVSPENMLLTGTTGFSETSPGAALSGREIRWRYTDFEPTVEDNLQVSLVMPSAWQKVVQERENVRKNPNDGEAWGRLGKVYKEIAFLRRGLREDDGGSQVYEQAVDAYEKATTLKPNDALWHYGFADLVWWHYYWDVYLPEVPDHAELTRTLEQLHAALAIDPYNQRALDLLAEIDLSIPGVVQPQADNGYDFLALTATPTFVPTRTPDPTETNTPAPTLPPSATVEATVTLSATQTAAPAMLAPTQAQVSSEEQPASKEKKSGLPLCGAALLPVAWFGVVSVKRRSAR